MAAANWKSVRLTGLLQAAGALGCAATVVGWLGAWHWTFDLFAHFRLQYALGLGVIAVLLIVLGRRPSAVFSAIFCLANLAAIAPLYLPADTTAVVSAAAVPAAKDPAGLRGNGPPLRVLTLNVNAGSGDPLRVAEYLRSEDADIVALQEINSRWRAELEILSETYPHHLIIEREDNFGIALFSRWPFVVAEAIYPAAVPLPSIRARVDLGGRVLQVIATHPPPPMGGYLALQQQAIFTALADEFAGDESAVLLGDLNATRWGWGFRELRRRSGLLDSSAGFGLQPTWPMPLWPLWIPIDHVLHSQGIRVIDRRTGPQVGADHLGISADLQLPSR